MIRNCTKVTLPRSTACASARGSSSPGLCDLAVAAESATFSIPEGIVGIADPTWPNVLFTKTLHTSPRLHGTHRGNGYRRRTHLLGYGIVQPGSPPTVSLRLEATNELAAAVRNTTPTSSP